MNLNREQQAALFKAWAGACRRLGVPATPKKENDAVRYRETECALGYAKSAADIDPADEFTLVLFRFNDLQDRPEIAGTAYTADERLMIKLANWRRNPHRRPQIERCRALFEKIEPSPRIHVLRDRFKLELFEQCEEFSPADLKHFEFTLYRLAREYPTGGTPVQQEEIEHAH